MAGSSRPRTLLNEAQLSITCRIRSAKLPEHAARIFEHVQWATALSDLNTLVQTYNSLLDFVPKDLLSLRLRPVALEVLVCQVLNDYSCSNDTLGM